MKTTHTLLTFFFTLATAAAAPALIWKHGAAQTTIHHSDEISAQQILPQERGVVFVLNRLPNGDEALTGLALPQASALPAHCHHHSVQGVTSVAALAQQASMPVAQVTLDEYNHLPQVIEQLKTVHNGVGKRMMKSKLRAQELEAAQVLFVSVNADESDQLDATLAQAIQNEPHVVLTAVRSMQEIKREREMTMQYRMQMQRKAGLEVQQTSSRRRRLEEDAGQQNQQQEQQQQNHQYMNLVHMTPNILSGILFTLLFATITMIGISCMGAIQGQDVYVKKMPAIGREA